MNKRTSIFLTLLVVVLSLFVGPAVSLAAPAGGSTFTGDIVPECDSDNNPANGIDNICGYCDLMPLAQNIINFLIFFAIIVAILMIVYAGFLYLTAGGNTGQITKAHNVFKVVIIGLVLTLASWLIVNMIMSFFLDSNTFTDIWTLPGC